jgi:hypothetical protein
MGNEHHTKQRNTRTLDKGLLKTIYVASINQGLMFAYREHHKELMGVGFAAKLFY